MKHIFSKLVLVAFVFSMLSGTAMARECTTCKKTNAKSSAAKAGAAVCKRAQSTAELNVNNVRTLINGYGNMWYDGSVAQYHIPKNGNTCPLFCAALWIGGTDVNDQLRIAALRFGSEGDDYWPGPLTTDNTASTDLPICNKYDKHFVITKAEVQNLMSYFDYSTMPATRLGTPENVSDVIKNWPAHGGENQSNYLAPFFDANGDGVYNWENGDYPYYDFDNELCPKTLKAALDSNESYSPKPTMETDAGIVRGGILSDQVLKGDQTIWWIFNDMGNTHTESNGQAIGLEIRAQAFAFSTNDEINNMTFYTYEIINRSTYELRETYFSQWVDADLGYAFDDFIGCDVKRGLGYCYNGDESDGPGSGSYSGIPPAVGIDFFQGPYMDPDGKDNPKIDIQKILNGNNTTMQNLLAKYKFADGTYDTIRLSDDADMFYPDGWYFTPGDAIGNCAINGVNFGNNIIDDERFGMRRFVYYNNSSDAISGEPSKATDYYNYLRGYWKNGQRMKYGGNAIATGTTDLDCDFMFPGDSDPWHWGTDGEVPSVNPDDWTEVTSGSNVTPGDRRFMQSAGPFTLQPGALNYITVGIPFAQATSGNAWSSVELLREVDDVCQALFENCFKVLDGPDAPTLIAQELNNEVILYLTYNNPESNNYGESYQELDPAIPTSYVDPATNEQKRYTDEQRSYKFEGYQIYQLKDASVSVTDIGDITKARLVAQCDVENYYDSLIYTQVTTDSVSVTVNDNPSLPIGTLINYTQNSSTGLLTGNIMVNGANKGIQHVFRITTDQFATGTNTALVNNKEYYFICVAYAHNRFKEYSQTEAAYLDGQKEPYLSGRKTEWGKTIVPTIAIPHNPFSENGGTIAQAEFGMCPNITRIEGFGNGGSNLMWTADALEELMGKPGEPGKPAGSISNGGKMSNPCIIPNVRFEQNYGPVNVRIIDPLQVKGGQYVISFTGIENDSRWVISNADPSQPLWDTIMTDTADFVIGRYNEQLFLDLGISVAITNPKSIASDMEIYKSKNYNGYSSYYYGNFVNEGAVLGSSMTFSDNSKQWLSGIPDNDNYMTYNWIRAGSQFAADAVTKFVSSTRPVSMSENYVDEDYYKYRVESRNPVATAIDKTQEFESVVGGLWAPYGLVSTLEYHPGFNYTYYAASDEVVDSLCNYSDNYKKLFKSSNTIKRKLMNNRVLKSLNFNDLNALPSVRIVFTSDTSKWTRCPVLEMCDDYTQSEGQVRRFHMRAHKSVDKTGKTVDDYEGMAVDTTNPNNPAYIHSYGMGWFPGYAISLATGERLNVMFGEDSRYVQYNGRDMMWNPVSTMMDGTQNYVLGGRHYIYVMNSTNQKFFKIKGDNVGTDSIASYPTPSYDGGAWASKMLGSLNRIMTVDDPFGSFMCHGLVGNEDDLPVVPTRDSISLLFASCAWVNMPLVNSRYQFDNPMDIPCDVTVDINVNMPYGRYMGANQTTVQNCTGNNASNNENPKYMFELTSDIVTLTNQAAGSNIAQSVKDSLLSMINVVPNPYYSYSSYETKSQLETKVRFTNVPKNTTISIYTIDGTLVRQFKKVTPASSTYDWDLHNHNGIPIAGGLYLIHFNVPEVGERVVKWFGTMRPVDLNSYQF